MSNPHVPSVAREWGRIEVSPGVEIAYTERRGGTARRPRTGLDDVRRGVRAPLTDPETFAADFAAWLLDRAREPHEEQWLAAMHLDTPRHAAESLLVSAMFNDHTDLARSLNAQVPFANAVRRDCVDEARP